MKGDWVPVSQALPKENGTYIIQFGDGTMYTWEFRDGVFGNEIYYGDDGVEFAPLSNEKPNNTVVAWMELPQHYYEWNNCEVAMPIKNGKYLVCFDSNDMSGDVDIVDFVDGKFGINFSNLGTYFVDIDPIYIIAWTELPDPLSER